MKKYKFLVIIITVALIAGVSIFFACEKEENSKVNQKSAAGNPTSGCCITDSRSVDSDLGLCCQKNDNGYCLPCVVVRPQSDRSFTNIVDYLKECNEQEFSDFFSEEENLVEFLPVLLLPNHKEYLDKLCSGNYTLNKVLQATNGITYLEFVNVSDKTDFFRTPVWLLS